MRVTLNSTLRTYSSNLQARRQEFDAINNRIGTGRDINKPSDNPGLIGEIKRLQSNIARNEVLQKNVQDGLTDTQIIEAELRNFESTMLAARDVATEAANPIHADKLDVLADKFLGMINDMIEIANYEFDGRLAFSGTLTTRESITAVAPASNDLPFELVEDPALVSTDNPLGLRVMFKGNFDERRIATGTNATERINSLADDAFGAGGVEAFDNLIRAYNIMAYTESGSLRTATDGFTEGERNQLQDAIRQISNSVDAVNSEIGRLGGVVNRMEAIEDRLTFENTRLNELRSLREDTDLIEAAIELRKEENALNATLSIGQTIFQPSLLDFLG